MKRNWHNLAQVLPTFRDADQRLSEGQAIAPVVKQSAINDQTFHRRRNRYGRIKADEPKRLKEVEIENRRLKTAVADLTLDEQTAEEAIKGDNRARRAAAVNPAGDGA